LIEKDGERVLIEEFEGISRMTIQDIFKLKGSVNIPQDLLKDLHDVEEK